MLELTHMIPVGHSLVQVSERAIKIWILGMCGMLHRDFVLQELCCPAKVSKTHGTQASWCQIFGACTCDIKQVLVFLKAKTLLLPCSHGGSYSSLSLARLPPVLNFANFDVSMEAAP